MRNRWGGGVPGVALLDCWEIGPGFRDSCRFLEYMGRGAVRGERPFLFKGLKYRLKTMNLGMLSFAAVVVLSAGGVMPGHAEIRKQERRSLIDSEPDVVYTEEFTDKKIELLAIESGTVYATKKGGRKLGVLKLNSKAKLIGFTERAYKIQGEATHASISGWVSPKALASKDKDFVENLKKVYERQLEVRELIANHEVAIGMSMGEVGAALGKPTKTKVRRTAKGQSGSWEFIEYEEVDHFQTVRDPYSGNIFRQKTHTTKEELNKLVVEFENDVVTAIEETENNEGGGVKVVVPPLFVFW
jgi:hypothetical protein